RGAGAAPTGAWWWRLTAGLAGGLLLYGAYCFLHSRFHWDGTEPLEYVQARATAQLTTFGPPLVLLAIVLGVCLGVGLQKDRLGEELREWWSSLCARLLIAAGVWTSVNLVALYGTALVLWASPWAVAMLTSGWLLTVAGGVLAGGSKRTEATRP